MFYPFPVVLHHEQLVFLLSIFINNISLITYKKKKRLEWGVGFVFYMIVGEGNNLLEWLSWSCMQFLLIGEALMDFLLVRLGEGERSWDMRFSK